MSFGVGPSLFDDPIGLIRPIAAGGGGGGQIIGLTEIRFNSATDPSPPAFTQDVSNAVLKLLPDSVDFTQDVSDTLLKFDTSNSFTMEAETAMRWTLFAATSFDQDVSRLQFETSAFTATAATWIDDLAICTGFDSNHDGTALEIEGSAGTKKTALIGFDLSGFDTNSTIVSAEMTVTVNNAPTATTGTDSVINNATHTWSEGSVSCSTDPGPHATRNTAETFTVTTSDAGVTKTITLNSDHLAEIEDRMGVGSWTCRIEGDPTDPLTANHDLRDEDAAGAPTLKLIFTVPVS